MMNGEVLVQSVVGEGTEFEVRLPLVETLNFNVCTKEQPFETNHIPFLMLESTTNTINNEAKDTILLVEDNPALQQFIQSILAPYYNVIVTNNGLEALEKLSRIPKLRDGTNCQLILSDIMMPEMDGFTLLEKVKSDDKFCSIPFILLTARAAFILFAVEISHAAVQLTHG